jgi:hypothetical protein
MGGCLSRRDVRSSLAVAKGEYLTRGFRVLMRWSGDVGGVEERDLAGPFRVMRHN